MSLIAYDLEGSRRVDRVGGAVYWPSVCRAPPPPTRGAPHAQDVAEALFSANASNHTT